MCSLDLSKTSTVPVGPFGCSSSVEVWPSLSGLFSDGYPGSLCELLLWTTDSTSALDRICRFLQRVVAMSLSALETSPTFFYPQLS